MHVKLKGLKKVKKTLASGKRIYYCYAWRGGPLLKHRSGEPIQPGDPLLVNAFATATKNRFGDSSETMGRLISEFKGSSAFADKSAKTRQAYSRYLDLIRDEFGDMPLEALQDKSARGEFKKWRDTMSATPRAADYAWTTLARVLSFAKDRGMIAVNVAERGGRLYEADRTEKIWTEDDVRAVLALHKPDISAALLMALWTGQRQGDLLRSAWPNYDGLKLRVRQGKTGARVVIPLSAPVRAMLDKMRAEALAGGKGEAAVTILTNSYGKPWTSDGFRASWRKACALAGVRGLTFHDLRGTAVTRLALSGCNTAQIASITGHSMKDVESILDAHYMGGKIELAEQAILKLEGKGW